MDRRYSCLEDIRPDPLLSSFLKMVASDTGRYNAFHLNPETEAMRQVSDRFCQHCGYCCPPECAARYEEDGEVLCRLHGNEGEPEHFYPEYLDPSKGKPHPCIDSGPFQWYFALEDHEHPPCARLIREAVEKFEGAKARSRGDPADK